jgi:hypothetical protein
MARKIAKRNTQVGVRRSKRAGTAQSHSRSYVPVTATAGLREEFDILYARMQTAASRKGIDRLLSASANELNETARKPRG